MTAFNRTATRKGVVLILAVFSLLILAILAGGFIIGSISEHQMSFNQVEAKAGVQCADGGIAWGYQWLKAQSPPPCGNTGAYNLGTYSYPDGSTATVSLVYADSNRCSDQYQGWGYTIRSDCTRRLGGRQNVTRTEMQVTMRKETPACMIISGCCAINAWYGDFDVTNGRLHTNKKLQVSNSSAYPPKGARFYGRVTVSASSFQCSGYNEGGGCPDGYATFYEGYEINVPQVDCAVDVAQTISCASGGGKLLLLPGNNNGTYLTLIPDGTVRIYQPGGSTPPWNTPPNGVVRSLANISVIAVDANGKPGDIYLRGTLRGRLTVVAGRRIVVDGDILYATDPRMDPTSTDRLGLMGGWKTGSDGDMFFPQRPGVEGDRNIFGFYVGTHCNASIRVENATSREREGIMMIYGGIMQGQLHATENNSFTSGYGTDWNLDLRGCADPPPCFPDLRRSGGSVNWQAMRADWREVL